MCHSPSASAANAAQKPGYLVLAGRSRAGQPQSPRTGAESTRSIWPWGSGARLAQPAPTTEMDLERHEATAACFGSVPGPASAQRAVEYDAPIASAVAYPEVAPSNSGGCQQQANHCGPVHGATLPTDDLHPASPKVDDSACTPAIISQSIGRVRRHGKKGKHRVSGRRRIVVSGNTYIIEMMAATIRVRKLHARRSYELHLVTVVDEAIGQKSLL